MCFSYKEAGEKFVQGRIRVLYLNSLTEKPRELFILPYSLPQGTVILMFATLWFPEVREEVRHLFKIAKMQTAPIPDLSGLLCRETRHMAGW